MKQIKHSAIGIILSACLYSCTVQQLPVNTQATVFGERGKVFGEKTKGKDFLKSKDIFILGINVHHSNVQEMVTELRAEDYTIETKNHLLFTILTGGILEYRIVKVIKREH